MSSLIEQAAKRLEQLRAAGVEVPEVPAAAATPEAEKSEPRPSMVEAAVARAQAEQAAVPATPAAAAAPVAATAAAAATTAAAVAAAPTPAAAPVRAAPPAAPARPAAAPKTSASPVSAPGKSRQVELDLQRMSAAGILVAPNAPRNEIAEQFRVIKRPLIANAVGRGAATVNHGNLIMVTSAVQGEGKSFTAVNLAMSIAAELDHTVMLVDADVARPSIVGMLGLPEGPGLLDVVQGQATLADALLRTNVDKLTILPSGKPHPRANELLASDGMNRLLAEMATRYADRIIIFDSPPLLQTTESRVLATHMGQIVVVVAAARTLQSDVESALQTIEACPLKLLVLNKAPSDATSYSYSYGYQRSQGGVEPALQAGG